MDRVHDFNSWVHGIDQSRLLILIQAARILLKWKGIGDLIPTLHLWVDNSYHTRPTRVAHKPGATACQSSAPELSEHGDAGFWGQNDAGVDGVLTRAKTRRGTAPWWLAAVASRLWARAMVSGGFGTLPASISSSTPSSWPPLASRPVQWLQSMTFSSNLVTARVRWVSSFVG
jgi:hypothetical protein